MSIIDSLLQKKGYKYEDLNDAERETISTMVSAIQAGELTVEKIKEYIHSMKMAVEQELSETEITDKKDLLLKARLRNYILFEEFLAGPERAKKALERSLNGLSADSAG